MNRNQWIDNCPDCDELLLKFSFKKAFLVEDRDSNGWSGVEAYYCAGCDKLLITVGFGEADRETFWILRSVPGEFTIPASLPGRAHPCYNSHVIQSQAALFASGFAARRNLRAQIGPRRKPDDSRFTLAIAGELTNVSEILETLGEWLANTNSGKVTSQEFDSGECRIHFDFTDKGKGRAMQMVNRLVRKFGLIRRTKLYRYNEGRRYL